VILLTALAATQTRPYRAPDLKYVWLVPAALLPQLVVAYLPGAWQVATRGAASAALPLSLVAFLVFVWVNRGLPGMPILLAGLVLNLFVISSNGGWMPISPETATQLPGGSDAQSTPLGSRFGQKDILLLPQDTRLEYLADRFLLPGWMHYATAFSLGDVFVAVGAFWLLALQRAAPNPITME
jgi:hypothetical protein